MDSVGLTPLDTAALRGNAVAAAELLRCEGILKEVIISWNYYALATNEVTFITLSIGKSSEKHTYTTASLLLLWSHSRRQVADQKQGQHQAGGRQEADLLAQGHHFGGR